MRIAYVCADPGVPVFGRKGASVHVQAVLRVLVARGAEVHLLAVRTGGVPPAGLEQVAVHALPEVPKGEVADRERAAQAGDAAVAPVLTRLAQAEGLDLVYERYSLWGRVVKPSETAQLLALLAQLTVLVEAVTRLRETQHRAAQAAAARSAAEQLRQVQLSYATSAPAGAGPRAARHVGTARPAPQPRPVRGRR